MEGEWEGENVYPKYTKFVLFCLDIQISIFGTYIIVQFLVKLMQQL